MDNNNYNEPRRDYCSPEEERYDRPLYETAEEYNQARREREQVQSQNGQYDGNYSSTAENTQDSGTYNYDAYGNNMYDNNTYGNNSYGYNVYEAPMKNNFGIKLTLSILEMLCCCTSCVTMIMGIISCVFTCQANSCYQQGRYDEYKSKSTASTVLLTIGAVFAAVSLIFNSINMALIGDDFWSELEYQLSDEFGYDVDIDSFLDDDSDYFYDDEADHPLYEDFNQITIDGVTVTLPCSYAELESLGFFMNMVDMQEEVPAYSKEYYSISCTKKAYVADIEVVNTDGTPKQAKDCLVSYLNFHYEGDAEAELFAGYEFVEGIKMTSTEEDVLEILGNPNYSYFYDDSSYGKMSSYTWYYEHTQGYMSYISMYFYDGVIDSIGIQHGPSLY